MSRNRTSRWLLIGAALLLMPSSSLAAQPALDDLPTPVLAIIQREARCNALSVQERSRRRDCEPMKLASDRKALRLRFRAQPKAAEALRGNWVKVVQRVPVVQ